MSIRTIGVIGCGGHLVTGHLPFLGTARVSGMFDPDPVSRIKAIETLGYGPERFETAEALVASQPDAIMIGSPDAFHPAQLALAVNAGIPVLCEKPLAVDASGEEIVCEALTIAKECNLFVASCHQRRSALNDLAYGWIKANLAMLEESHGKLVRIRFSSIYPAPRQSWKHGRSFLADKFVHDIDYLRYLLDTAQISAERQYDSHDHYIVHGSISGNDGRQVEFDCEGTRLHGDRHSFVEYILLTFESDDTCAVYAKSGIVRRSGHQDVSITPMVSNSYDRLNRFVTERFVSGEAMHTPDDLLINTTVVSALTTESGVYSSRF